MRLNFNLIFTGFLAISVNTAALSQIIATSHNRMEEYKGNYYERKNSEDTILIVLDLEQKNVKIREKVILHESNKFQEIIYSKNYPPPTDSCVELRFRHHPGPPMASEEFLITKSGLSNITVIDEYKTEFSFWFHNDSKLFEKTLILVKAKDWFSEKESVKGKGVQIYTTGSCNDLEENNEYCATTSKEVKYD
jgi:hypothetical protein